MPFFKRKKQDVELAKDFTYFDKSLLLLPHNQASDSSAMQKLSQQLRRIDDLGGREFEALLEKLFELLGYDIISVSKAGRGDSGIDFIVKMNGIETAIQAKAWRLEYTETIGSKFIRELAGSMALLNRPNLKGCFITTNFFTPDAVKTAKEFDMPIELIDRHGVFQLFGMLNPSILANIAFHELSQHMGYCKKCGHVLVKKWSQKDGRAFKGCPKFPDCQYMEPWHDIK